MSRASGRGPHRTDRTRPRSASMPCSCPSSSRGSSVVSSRSIWFRYGLFFSSRRRHTRFDCDWSSDVCSSDLVCAAHSGSSHQAPCRIYDPRKGLGGYYRYGPRKLVQLCNAQYSKKEDDEVLIERPKIHESVFRRIDNHAHAYAPVGLPPTYDVVKENGTIVTPDQYGFENDNDAKARADAP